MVELIKKYKEIIVYLIFGVLTTLLNLGCFALCFGVLNIPNVPSNIIAWIVAVVFAFITNKLFVFESRSFEGKVLLREFIEFISARLATGILEIAIMFVSVDVLKGNAYIFKFITIVIVTVLNYVFSKVIIFKKVRKEEPEQ